MWCQAPTPPPKRGLVSATTGAPLAALNGSYTPAPPKYTNYVVYPYYTSPAPKVGTRGGNARRSVGHNSAVSRSKTAVDRVYTARSGVDPKYTPATCDETGRVRAKCAYYKRAPTYTPPPN